MKNQRYKELKKNYIYKVVPLGVLVEVKVKTWEWIGWLIDKGFEKKKKIYDLINTFKFLIEFIIFLNFLFSWFVHISVA